MAGNSIKLSSDKPSQRLYKAAWLPELRHIVSALKITELCEPNGIKVYTRDDEIVITANFYVEIGSANKTCPLEPIEPMALVFKRDKLLSQAPLVFSNRADFPRDFHHLNPVKTDSPAHLCLANFSLDEPYRNFGIELIAVRLNNWLRDAANDDLAKDGWHPLPPYGQPTMVKIDLAGLQDMVLEQTDCAETYFGAAESLGSGDEKFYIIHNLPIDKQIPVSLQNNFCPIMLLKSEESISVPIFDTVETGEDIATMLSSIGFSPLANPFDSFATGLLTVRKTRALLLIGVWRPAPIPSATVGLSSNVEARKLEVKAYEIKAGNALTDRLVKDRTLWKAREAVLYSPANHEMLRRVSGNKHPQKVCLIGYGALGSVIFDFLIRGGIKEATVFDDDRIEVHNLARHTAVANDVLKFKSSVAASMAVSISGDIKVTPIPKLANFSSTEEASTYFEKTDLIIDATADSFTRQHLSFDLGALLAKAVRVEIFDQGRLGVISVSGRGNNPDFQHIFAALCAAALEDDAIANWIRRDRERQMRLDSIDVGMTCSSSTIVLPKECVSLHAAAFMPKLREVSAKKSDAGFGINPLSPIGTPMGWQWFPITAPKPYTPTDAPDWKVRVAPGVRKLLNKETRKKRPNETGGYLYGVRNLDAKAIDVMLASTEPPKTVGTPTSLKLGPSGKTDIERRIHERCAPRIHLVGSWHSHPDGGVKMSAIDKAEMDRTQRKDRNNGLPTLMLICNGSESGVHLRAD